MQTDYQASLSVVLTVVRRIIRLFKRIQDTVNEEDLQQTLDQYIEEHEDFVKQLKKHIDDESKRLKTPDAIIQFPLSVGELLAISAKTEKQVLDQLSEMLENKLPQPVEKTLQQRYPMVEKSYDYLQALADIWV